ncbi:hypothetical protein DRW07_14900 [Alteromonas sediminis]|uniref:Uncharacterized protein n=1 Tax=Alteromonas sediminis TaxID=2259342 RepID=A0A3N5YB01_9ALTE|nr:hypothetical protein [Alteromonas sediminis]RPJ66085.1 hypothetical protein DRW07_14900 [Alteromonas sediminis]
MNGKTLLNRKVIISFTCVLALVILGFFSNEARKEIYFLCGNFKEGISLSSVRSQLDTAKLSSYKLADNQAGKSISHSSWLVLRLASCNINFNEEGIVLYASFG